MNKSLLLINAFTSMALLSGCDDLSKMVDPASRNDVTSFGYLCKTSGGTADGEYCICNYKVCDRGVLCNTLTKKCPESTNSESKPEQPTANDAQEQLRQQIAQEKLKKQQQREQALELKQLEERMKRRQDLLDSEDMANHTDDLDNSIDDEQYKRKDEGTRRPYGSNSRPKDDTDLGGVFGSDKAKDDKSDPISPTKSNKKQSTKTRGGGRSRDVGADLPF